jgi:hypothetical protein
MPPVAYVLIAAAAALGVGYDYLLGFVPDAPGPRGKAARYALAFLALATGLALTVFALGLMLR